MGFEGRTSSVSVEEESDTSSSQLSAGGAAGFFLEDLEGLMDRLLRPFSRSVGNVSAKVE